MPLKEPKPSLWSAATSLRYTGWSRSPFFEGVCVGLVWMPFIVSAVVLLVVVLKAMA